MWTGISALLVRNLRIDARLLKNHLFRLVFATFIYFCLFRAQFDVLNSDHPGLDFFSWMANVNAIFICLAGVSFFASAITEEKEEETLGLMQMANIGPLSVLLGKSTSRLWQALLLLLVQFPFGLLAITLGGVTWHQVFCVYVALGAFTIGLANVALVCSVVSSRSGSASTLTFSLLMIYLLACPLAAATITAFGGSTAGDPLIQWLYDTNVFVALNVILVTNYSESAFSWQVVQDASVGLFAFFLARLLWDRFALNATPGGISRMFVPRSGRRFRLFTPERAWGGGLAWKDFHFIAGGWPTALGKLLCYPLIWSVICWVNLFNGVGMRLEESLFPYAGILSLLWVCEGGYYASRVFHDEIRLQTMSSLLMLPQGLDKVVWSKTLGCLLALVPVSLHLGLALLLIFQNVDGERQWGMLVGLTHPMTWYLILSALFFMELTAVLSVYVRWGALPLAGFVSLMLNWCCPLWVFVGFGVDPDGAYWPTILFFTLIEVVVFGMISVVLVSLLLNQLRALGSK